MDPYKNDTKTSLFFFFSLQLLLGKRNEVLFVSFSLASY